MINMSFIGRILSRKSTNLYSRVSINFKPPCRNCAIRRALLYVPGDDERKLRKSLSLKVDCIAMDCEDGVALNKKDEARQKIREFLDEGPVTKCDPEWCVRVNPVHTPQLCEADLEVLLSAKNLPASICLPKVNTPDDLQWFAEKVWNVLIKRPENDRGPLKLLMIIESAVAIMTLPEICKKAQDLATMAPLTPAALIFGSDDLLASLGATRTEGSLELFYARQKLVLVAKAFGLQAIDMVFINYKNPKKFESTCEDGAIMGYTGRQVIHPEQVTIAQDAFVPARSKIKWAKGVVKAFNESQEEGKGVFIYEKSMIDMPSVRQAQNILNVARKAGKLEE